VSAVGMNSATKQVLAKDVEIIGKYHCDSIGYSQRETIPDGHAPNIGMLLYQRNSQDVFVIHCPHGGFNPGLHAEFL
jgi:hypothetical protein